ncbi:GGDEF domain-containing protein [Denitromonas sp.]|uniref:GGDEF domain-containing protein n=1 Tax=Denitromonas sp. TaxID=2734609 RepID=UPI002AFE157C|nr:GGDEF domain-containing protein [Denitromonas sp.]
MSNMLINEWRTLHADTPHQMRQDLAAFVSARASALAEYFYQQMLMDKGTEVFLSHKRVEEHLKPSMCLWLERIFDASPDVDIDALFALQRHVGEVHARIGVPVELVARGARRLVTRILSEYGEDRAQGDDAMAAVRFVTDTIGIPVEVMASAYSGSYETGARADEAYRLFSTSQNLQVERERQRAALLAWETQFLYEVASGTAARALPLLGESEFGLWLNHKGAAMFSDENERADIGREIYQIDHVLLPMIRLSRRRNSELTEVVHNIKTRAAQIRFLLGTVFERLSNLEIGRDVLTQLLNRRFLSVILARETRLSRAKGVTFAALMIDIDHFKRINDDFGHHSGDVVLQHVAALLLNVVRGGDYVFRYGGEEFTVILVEVNLEQAAAIAEKIRGRLAEEQIPLPEDRRIRTTVSVGVACFDGHPDPARVVDLADKALYRAKTLGRNRVEMA